METLLRKIEKVIPKSVYRHAQPLYHYGLAFAGALWNRFPSRKVKVIAITGTKGKSSTTEILNAILEEAGFKTALSNTIRFKIGDESKENLYKMSMPGRFFVQGFLRRAVDAGCDYAVMEMTSQGALLFRNRFIELDAFVLTNISPEHIEAHGSYENYINSKLSICKALEDSHKRSRTIIVNIDDEESPRFLACISDSKMTYSLRDAAPYEILKEGLVFSMNGRRVTSPLSGLFNLYNIMAAITAARDQGVSDDIIIRAVEKFGTIAGRVQKIAAGQAFDVVVDYAHTADSLEKFYKVFAGPTKRICVLGGTGGGRDTWKRKEIGRIADAYCDEIILTDEDPYDEDPRKIVSDIKAGIKTHTPTIEMDRRKAIRLAIAHAKPGDAVLITGKGTDPYIMLAGGKKMVWSDAQVAREELGNK